MKHPPLTLLTGAVLLLTLAGCAAEPAPAETAPAAVAETTTPEPEIQVGDTLTADQAAELNAGTDLMKAYPVGGTFIAVQWGQPIPESVKAEVQAQVAAAATSWGTSTDAEATNREWSQVRDAMKQESQKLGGVTLALVSCVQSFSTQTNAFRPTWVMSEPGPVGEYESEEAVLARADAWSQDGKKMYVVVNNLGC